MRRSILVAAVVCLALSGVIAGSQLTATMPGTNQQRDAQAQAPAPTGTGVMMGTVTMAGTGQPVEGVRVTLNGTELRATRSAMTNDDGQFVFDKLPAGNYTVRGTRQGHIAGTYGQKQPGKPGTSIVLAVGQQLKDVTFEIAKGGVISGSVLDEKNRPSIGTPVRVMRWMIQSGERMLTTAGTGTTDDRGLYRIYNLSPGDYVVSAVPSNTAAEVLTSADVLNRARMEDVASRVANGSLVVNTNIEELRGSSDPAQGYAPVFYPGVTQLAGARAVRVGVAEEQLGIDFALQRVALTTVTGQVIVPGGQNPTTVQVRLLQAEGNALGLGQQSVRPTQTGTFTFRSVVPGQYTVFALATITEPRAANSIPGGAGQWESPNQPGTQRRIWAQSDLFVDGVSPPGVSLTMREGMPVSGNISFVGSAPQPTGTSTQRVRVSMTPLGQPLQSIGVGNLSAMVDTGGRFTINGVIPGKYRVTASGAQGWSVKTVIVNGIDVMDFPLEIAPDTNVSAVTVQFGDRHTDLKGVLTDAMGAATADYSVVIFPEDQRYWVPYARRMRSTRPATDGKFAFVGLPPGDYRVAAVTDVETGEWLDPEFLRQLLPASLSVRLADGQQVTQDIRVR